jgi:ribosome-binding protein aMBF1 (putative translation factor)
MEQGIDLAIARIRAFARHKSWPKSRLAREAGMRDTVLRDFDNPKWNPTAETVRRLEAIIPSDFVIEPTEAAPAKARRARRKRAA